MDGLDIRESAEKTLSFMSDRYSSYERWNDLHERIANVLSLSKYDDIIDIGDFGRGWVAEEALAMALYACLRFQGNPVKAIYFAVNHGGDSDSVGSIAGNILGAFYGYRYLSNAIDFSKLERTDVIRCIARDLADIGRSEYITNRTYIYGEIPDCISFMDGDWKSSR